MKINNNKNNYLFIRLHKWVVEKPIKFLNAILAIAG
jgi:hypothetical protein